jgi:hypothetical protein
MRKIENDITNARADMIQRMLNGERDEDIREAKHGSIEDEGPGDTEATDQETQDAGGE